jgi:hypothetical protein
MTRAALVAAFTSLAAPVAAGDFVLGQPIDCVLGQTCHIQQYVDRDPGPGAFDYTCGGLSYDDHKGTDFALSTRADMRRGVDILAAAPGIVAGLRDGMTDRVYTDDMAAEIEGRECGNGVVLRHADGYETQYCHMKSGSVRVQKGQQVALGAVLGQVGLSGQTQFPHVHLAVRHDGAMIDPFDTSAFPACGEAGPSLWETAPAYAPGGLIHSGFAGLVPNYEAVQDGTAGVATLTPDADAMVLFALAFGGRTGDVIWFDITGPDGVVMSQQATLEKDQAQFYRAAGKRGSAAGWPPGSYTGTVRMLRGTAEIDRMMVTVAVR